MRINDTIDFFLLCLFVLVIAWTTGAKAQPQPPILYHSNSRVVDIVGLQTDATPVVNAISNLSLKPGPILVIIDSPGGLVDEGGRIIDAMEAAKAAKSPIVCVVKELAASMAFNILGHCTQRYTLPGAKLLFHAPGVIVTKNTFLNRDMAIEIAAHLEPVEKVVLEDVSNFMHLPMNMIRLYASKNLFLTAEQMNVLCPRFTTPIAELKLVDP